MSEPNPQAEIDPLTKAEVIVIPSRQGRPNQPEGCPFCPGGLEAPNPYDVQAFPNRWPPLPSGRCEVLLYSSEHDATLGTLSNEQLEKVVRLWIERSDAMGARDDVDYVLPFENRGTEAGGTIPHPHGQLYGFTGIPPVIGEELTGDECPLCAAPPEQLVVATRGSWQAWCPPASGWPFERRLAPVRHDPFLATSSETPADFGPLLGQIVNALDALHDEVMPYFFFIHQAPYDDERHPLAHVHAHLLPLRRAPGTMRYVAAGEIGSGVLFNPVDPAEAARRLREQIESADG